MNDSLNYAAHLAHLDDLRREARRAGSRRVPQGAGRDAIRNGEDSIAIRCASAEDREALEHLAGRDSAPALSGAILIAEVRGEPGAAIEIATGAAIADPFNRTAHLIELLRVRAARLREAAAPRRRSRLPWRLPASTFRSG